MVCHECQAAPAGAVGLGHWRRARVRGAAASVRPEYLTPALREQVEALKQAVAREPTSAGTIVERSRVLADWIDAYSLSVASDALVSASPNVRANVLAGLWGTYRVISN